MKVVIVAVSNSGNSDRRIAEYSRQLGRERIRRAVFKSSKGEIRWRGKVGGTAISYLSTTSSGTEKWPIFVLDRPRLSNMLAPKLMRLTLPISSGQRPELARDY